MRTVEQFRNTLEYMHFNPVAKGLASKPEDWPWSSYGCYAAGGDVPLPVDLLDLPFDPHTPLT